MSVRRILRTVPILLVALAAMVAQTPRSVSAEARILRQGSTVTVGNDRVAVRYDLGRGLADYAWGGRTAIRNGYSGAVLSDVPGRTVYTFERGERTASDARFRDEIGAGVVLRVITNLADVDVSLVQQIFVYDDAHFLTQRVSLLRRSESGPPVRTDQIEVIAASPGSNPVGGVTIAPSVDPRFYLAPFYNNDDFAVLPVQGARGVLSHWLGGLIDAQGGHGLIAGAVETQSWKSGVWYDGPSGTFSAHSGTRSPVDTVSPAPRVGPQVDSALTFVGYRDDYQDALADLMAAVRAMEPPLAAPSLPAPVGWSAWYHHGIRTDEQIMRGVTDFIAENWAPLGYRYINLDAGWNRADGDTRYDPQKFPAGIESLVRYIHDRNLLAGAYFVPFAVSPSLLDEHAPGSDYRYRDMLVRDAQGEPIHASILDWEYVLDTTHPGALPLLYQSATRIAEDGFDFVKLDFLQIGTQEGVRHDPSVTAMEAFHRGMRTITEAWRDSGRPMFISAAISPLYIQPHVHARRVGNDVEFGQAREASNVALSWFTGLLYHRNDPDNAVVRPTWFPGYNDNLARLHATMAALGGTLFLAGDDPRELPPGRAALLTNKSVLALAREPLVIRPLTVAETPAPVWHAPAVDGSYIVAVFNWDGATSRRQTVRFADIDIDQRAAYSVFDLWAEQEMGMRESSVTVDLPPHGVALLRLTRRG